MARLEIEIAGVNDSLRAALKQSRIELSNFSKDISGIKLGSGITTELDKQKLALAEAKTRAQEYRAETARLSAEQKAFAASQAQSRGSITGATGSYREAQQTLTALGKSIREAQGGFDSSLPSVQAQIKQYNELNTRLKSFDALLGNHQRNVGNYSSALKGANGVAMEFNRIIQDAPFGAMGIGNNITQLTDNYKNYAAQVRAAAAEQGKVVSSGTILKGAISSIISPVNLLTLGISLAVSGYTAYTMWAQKSAKATRESKKTTQEYIETLEAVSRIQLEGAKSAQAELTNLRLLYSAYQNANLPLKDRKEAYKQIQDQYPDYFKNIKFEQIASDDTKAAYDRLTTSIIATSKARAAANLITKNSERQLENEQKINDELVKYDRARLEAANDLAKMRSGENAGSAQFLAREAANAEAEQAKSAKIIRDLKKDTSILTAENLRLEKATNQEIAKGGKLLTGGGTGTTKPKKEKVARNIAENIVTRSDNSESLLGLEGVDREVEQVRQKYAKMYDDLSANAKKSVAARKTYEQDFAKIQANEAAEFNHLILAEEARVSGEVQRIRETAGIKAADNIQKELATIDARYAGEIEKANGSAKILAAIEEGKQAEIQAVYDKYNAKRVEAEQAVTDKIQDLMQKGFTDNINGSARANAKIDQQLAERLAKVRDYYAELKKMNAANPMALLGLGVAEAVTTSGIKGQAAQAKNPVAEQAREQLRETVSAFGSDMLRTLRNISSQADTSFIGILGSIGNSLTDMLENTFDQQLKGILKNLVDGVEISSEQAIGAIAGVAGGIISGATKKTSYLGQGLGGAISGAGTGALMGTAIGGPAGTVAGAVIGGLVGAIGGLFGAGKARKQEKLEQQQLEEQRKQTALMERQNALAYASQIIGRQTVNGVVTAVEVNEFGQLTTKISGSDIKVVLDRANNNRQRGT